MKWKYTLQFSQNGMRLTFFKLAQIILARVFTEGYLGRPEFSKAVTELSSPLAVLYSKTRCGCRR